MGQFAINNTFKITKTILTIFLLLGILTSGIAATTIDTNNPYAYGANIGGVNAFADGANSPERLIFVAFAPVCWDKRFAVVSGSGQITTGEVL